MNNHDQTEHTKTIKLLCAQLGAEQQYFWRALKRQFADVWGMDFDEITRVRPDAYIINPNKRVVKAYEVVNYSDLKQPKIFSYVDLQGALMGQDWGLEVYVCSVSDKAINQFDLANAYTHELRKALKDN